jgi:hypothetical protein
VEPVLLHEDDQALALGTARAERLDGWLNPQTAIGTSRDKSSYTTLQLERVTPDQGELYWRADGVAKTIVERVVIDAMRPGHDLKLIRRRDRKRDRDLSERLEDRLRELDAVCGEDGEASAILGTLNRARAILGSAILPRYDDLRPLSEPIDVRSLLGRPISHLTILDARELSPLRWRFGGAKPGVEVWAVHQRTEGGGIPITTVHSSRLIRAHGDVTVAVPRSQQTLPGWPGDSCFVAVIEHLRRWCGGNASAGALLDDYAQMVYVIKGLADARGRADIYARLMKRLEAMELARSVVRGIALDEGESAHRETTSLAGFPDTLDRVALPLAAAAGYPVEVIFGRQAAGLNATGEAAIQIYGQRCDGFWDLKCKPLLLSCYRMLLVEAGENPDDWRMEVVARPRQTPSRLEDMQARLVRAQIDEIEIRSTISSAEEVALSRHGDDEYGWETQLERFQELDADETEEELDVDVSDLGGAPAPTDPQLLLTILEKYNGEEITRIQAVNVLAACGMDATAAETFLGPEEQKPPKPTPPPAFGFGGPPKPTPPAADEEDADEEDDEPPEEEPPA